MTFEETADLVISIPVNMGRELCLELEEKDFEDLL
jgi:hypothetical protein